MAMMAITPSNSTRVKPRAFFMAWQKIREHEAAAEKICRFTGTASVETRRHKRPLGRFVGARLCCRCDQYAYDSQSAILPRAMLEFPNKIGEHADSLHFV